MVVNLKRKREPVSYKEPSSDEDLSQDSAESYSSPKKRAIPQRRSTRHRLSETAQPSSGQIRRDASSNSVAPAAKTNTTRLRGRNRVSYRESSSDDDSDDDFDEEEVVAVHETPRQQTGQGTRHLRNERTSAKRPPKKALGAPLKRRTSPQQTATSPRKIVSDGIIPAWASLPYHVLLQIFVYASHPLHDENLNPYPSITWLARVARMCSTFTKPALTALYRNPPIFAVRQYRKELVQHLISPSSGAHEDYPVMVKRLELDATRMSKLTDPNNSANDLVALVTSLKTVKEIDIFDPFDKPPYRPRARHLRKWHYPDELFDTLRQTELRLRSWRWNSAYCHRGLMWIRDVHASDAFKSLREIVFTKYNPGPSKVTDDDQPSAEELLGTALAVLPNLRSLTFESCGIVNPRLLPLLPDNLVSLNITNCRELISEALHAFLTSHGGRLEELILDHNQCLNLSFLVDLKRFCPRLEVLRMDMHYYNSLSTTTDNEPLYDELLQEGDIPTWPATLRVLDLEFLRNWTPTAAIAFFTSLIESADELPWLRELVVIAMVDVDWRQRAEFRKNWTARFQRVFARKSSWPSPHLASLRAFREWKQGGYDKVNTMKDSFAGIELQDVNKHQICRDGAESDSDVPLVLRRKSRLDERWNSQRLRSRAKSAHYDETTSDELESDDDVHIDEVRFVQGLCHTVLFRIDNSRPQEQIYDERDFLDDEISGDEDWDGDDVVDDGYAW